MALLEVINLTHSFGDKVLYKNSSTKSYKNQETFPYIFKEREEKWKIERNFRVKVENLLFRKGF